MNPYEAPRAGEPQQPRPAAQDVASRDAWWALALGIASLVFCAPVTSPIAIWMAIRASRNTSSRMPTVGLVLACFGLLSSVVFWGFAVVWQYLAPRPHP